jgi:heme-degrading monooxygenase HmoA
MISRQWRGIAKSSEADRYVSHLKTETFPQLSQIPGFIAATILRRTVIQGVEFCIVTTWESLEAIGRFAGERLETAVVPEEVQAMMVTFDPNVVHYEVVD